jgi:hypothetical protein
MARFADDRVDDRDDILSTDNGKLPGWAMVLLMALTIGTVVLIGGAIAMFATRSAHDERAVAQANLTATRAAANRIYTRIEFKGLVLGSIPEDVKVTIGPPSFTLEEGMWSTWHYHNLTRDSITGAVDPITTVLFDKGVVIAVNFQAADANGKSK